MKNELNVDQIKKLWILELIVQSGSLKGAALRAKVSASAVSQSLTALESHVGKPLVIRNKGSITPTAEALSILAIVRPAFEAFEKLTVLGSHPIPQMTWLNFGTYESIAVDVLPGLIQSLRDKLPNLKLGLRIARTNQLLAMIRKGELCSAIITEVDDLDKFHTVKVATDRLGVYISNKHPLVNKGWKAVEHVGLGTLAPSKDGLPRYYSRFLKKLDGMKPTVLSESFETLRAATAGGAIASILPNRVATRTQDLIEITPTGHEKQNGSHNIYVISQNNCDADEAQFLADEVGRLLN